MRFAQAARFSHSVLRTGVELKRRDPLSLGGGSFDRLHTVGG